MYLGFMSVFPFWVHGHGVICLVIWLFGCCMYERIQGKLYLQLQLPITSAYVYVTFSLKAKTSKDIRLLRGTYTKATCGIIGAILWRGLTVLPTYDLILHPGCNGM